MEEGVADELEMLEVGDAPLLAWPGFDNLCNAGYLCG
jgi:hypothetical protein